MSNDGQYLTKLQDYYTRHRVLPSYSTIGKLIGLASKASVADMVLRLKAEGFLESTPGKRLKPGRRFFDRPFAERRRPGLSRLPSVLSRKPSAFNRRTMSATEAFEASPISLPMAE